MRCLFAVTPKLTVSGDRLTHATEILDLAVDSELISDQKQILRVLSLRPQPRPKTEEIRRPNVNILRELLLAKEAFEVMPPTMGHLEIATQQDGSHILRRHVAGEKEPILDIERQPFFVRYAILVRMGHWGLYRELLHGKVLIADHPDIQAAARFQPAWTLSAYYELLDVDVHLGDEYSPTKAQIRGYTNLPDVYAMNCQLRISHEQLEKKPTKRASLLDVVNPMHRRDDVLSLLRKQTDGRLLIVITCLNDPSGSFQQVLNMLGSELTGREEHVSFLIWKADVVRDFNKVWTQSSEAGFASTAMLLNKKAGSIEGASETSFLFMDEDSVRLQDIHALLLDEETLTDRLMRDFDIRRVLLCADLAEHDQHSWTWRKLPLGSYCRLNLADYEDIAKRQQQQQQETVDDNGNENIFIIPDDEDFD